MLRPRLAEVEYLPPQVFMPHWKTQHQPVFQRALQFSAASLQVFGLVSNALEAMDFTLVLPVYQNFIFCEPHSILNIGN
jgi:hypothetical protein